MKFLSLAAGLAVLASQVAALFDNVHTLDSANWAETVENDNDHVWLVTFYADWCPFCKSFETELSNALADPALKDKRIKFGAVDVMANRDLTTKYGIQRSPTVKVFGQDKFTPVDYVGHRKHADLVKYCGDYCTEHNYMVAPLEPTINYMYNIDAIVASIAGAHDARVMAANQAHQTELKGIEEKYWADVQGVKTDFDGRLQALINERSGLLSTKEKEAWDVYNLSKTNHAKSISGWDAEAIETIGNVQAAYKGKQDLTDYIPTLSKDWFNISWDNNNRRVISDVKPVAPAHGHGHGYNNHGPHNQYGAGHGYAGANMGGHGYGYGAPDAAHAGYGAGYGYGQPY